jgi:hypothetical protein
MTTRSVLQLLSLAALAGLVAGAVLFFADAITLETLQRWLLVTTVLWFVTTPFWVGRPG